MINTPPEEIISDYLPPFGELFSLFISKNRIFKISYDIYPLTIGDARKMCLLIGSVNDCDGTTSFFDSVVESLSSSIEIVKAAIISLSDSDKIAVLKDFRRIVSDFNSSTTEDYIEFENEKGELIDEVTFPVFKFYKLIGPTLESTGFTNERVLFETQDYCKAYISAIEFCVGKIDSIINGIENLDFLLIQNKVSQVNSNTKFPTSLSVEELACFFRLLSDENVIQIPKGKKAAFYRFIASNFSSKKQPTISEKSFKNDFESLSTASINSVQTLLANLVKAAAKKK